MRQSIPRPESRNVVRLAALFLVIATATSDAQQSSPCSARQYRQFDFLIGEWEVSDTRGQRLGANRIERILDGCVLYESWTGASGSRGHSFNTWDPSDNKWHQSWFDNEGTILNISGGMINGEMVMEGDRRLADGTRQLERITWTPDVDGTIRQLWQSSRDQGMRWTVVFEGIYRKAKPRSDVEDEGAFYHSLHAVGRLDQQRAVQSDSRDDSTHRLPAPTPARQVPRRKLG